MKKFIIMLCTAVIFFSGCDDPDNTPAPKPKPELEQVSAPTTNRPNGYFVTPKMTGSSRTATLLCSTEGAVIYYTTDDSVPTTGSSVYSGPIQLNQNMVLKAMAAKSGMRNSEILEMFFTVISSAEQMEFAASMKIGWNLGNTLDGHSGLIPSETQWQSVTTTQALMNAVKDKGFEAVRIPVTWGRKLHDDLRRNPSQINLTVDEIKNLKIDDAWLNRVAVIVGYAKTAGLKAIINIHHDGADSNYWLSVRKNDLTGENKEKVDAIFTTIWSQVAEKFKNEGSYLVFEGFNELHDGNWGYTGSSTHSGVVVTTSAQDLTNQYARITELNQLFVKTVRAAGGENANRFLLIHGLVTRPSIAVQHLVLPFDPTSNRLIVGIHYYDPYDFAGSAAWSTWGDKSLTGSNGWANESHVRSQFDDVKRKFIDNGIPIIIGEYGAVRQSSANGKAHRLYYMEYVTKYAVDCGFIPIYWDNGSTPSGNGGREQFGLFSRTPPIQLANDAEGIINVMMKAAYENYSINDIQAP